MATIGIIGGSGLNNADVMEEANELDALKDERDIKVTTSWGDPSSPLRSMKIAGHQVYLLARHGRQHTIPPTFVNYRANIKALKDLGCDYILATTACGSLRTKIDRGHLVVLDQFIDFTRRRPLTYHETFEPENAAHTPMPEPFDPMLRELLIKACSDLDIPHHERGTVVTIEGPRFSTIAESKMFRSWGADVINMSIATEAIMANEAGVPYGAVAMSTDYDCWKEDEEPVSWDEILTIFKGNAEKVTTVLVNVVSAIS